MVALPQHAQVSFPDLKLCLTMGKIARSPVHGVLLLQMSHVSTGPVWPIRNARQAISSSQPRATNAQMLGTFQPPRSPKALRTRPCRLGYNPYIHLTVPPVLLRTSGISLYYPQRDHLSPPLELPYPYKLVFNCFVTQNYDGRL